MRATNVKINGNWRNCCEVDHSYITEYWIDKLIGDGKMWWGWIDDEKWRIEFYEMGIGVQANKN